MSSLSHTYIYGMCDFVRTNKVRSLCKSVCDEYNRHLHQPKSRLLFIHRASYLDNQVFIFSSGIQIERSLTIRVLTRYIKKERICKQNN